MKFNPNICPLCNSPATGRLERVFGVAKFSTSTFGDYEYSGGTDVEWNTQVPVEAGGKNLLRCPNNHEWWAKPIYVIYKCGICGAYHPWDWDRDCRDDEYRKITPEDYARELKVPLESIEVRSMDERTEADLE